MLKPPPIPRQIEIRDYSTDKYNEQRYPPEITADHFTHAVFVLLPTLCIYPPSAVQYPPHAPDGRICSIY